ncbi:MAG: NAD(P)H-dependent oxidoreductase [Pirellulales bacterium]|nr:NAD(P)H-dependent oxidoreductase [Pirellulales bacterium]
MAKILAFAGSARRDSFNKKLVATAVAQARELGAEVTHVDLRDFPMPLYDGDLEEAEGYPQAADRLYALMKEHSGLLLACPEYNSSITPLLKNTIDWVSRPRAGDGRLAAYQGKVATLLAASPGELGGLRGLIAVRSILGNIGVTVLPTQVAVAKADKAFAEDGALIDESAAKRVAAAMATFVATVRKLA